MESKFNKLKKLFKLNQKIKEIETAIVTNNSNQPNPQPKICNQDFFPLRKLYLWGWDRDNNPSFLVLYGLHKFHINKNNQNELEDHVFYTNYIVFKGKEGHFPSYESVKILEERNYKNNTTRKAMYYKRDISCSGYSYVKDKSKAITNFVSLDEKSTISLPYSEELTQEDYARIIFTKNIQFKDFKLANTRSEVIQIPSELEIYTDQLINLLGNQRVYMRKKYLQNIIKSKPPRSLYGFLLRIGSSELISGLFLELSLQKDNTLIEEANNLITSDINWADENYVSGVKRCVTLYTHYFDNKQKEQDIEFINQNLPDMDLHIQNVNGKELPIGNILEGATYRKYSYQGYLSEYYGYYSYEQRKYIMERRSNIYKKSYYSDGVVLNMNNIKHTIQMAEIYGLPDVLGKIAYYLDAPRLTYYCKGNGKYKGLQYLRKYIRRILDSYAKNNNKKFMIAIKVLLTSYTNVDYLCKFKGNFQFNYYIKHYLYNTFNESAPDSWYERYQWFSHDQLMKQECRCEFMPNLWNEHLEELIDIINEVKIPVILKAFYYILNDTTNRNLIIELSYDKLLLLITVDYEPISEFALEIINEKLKGENNLTTDTIIQFFNCQDNRINEIAMEYFESVKSQFTAEHIITFLMVHPLASWINIIQNTLEGFNQEEYINFIQIMMNRIDDFIKYSVDWQQDISEIIEASLNKQDNLSELQAIDLLTSVITQLRRPIIPNCIIEFMEKIIFSNTYTKLVNIIGNQKINLNQSIVLKRSRIIIELLNTIKQNSLPSDRQLQEILELGSSKMLKILIEIVTEHEQKLHTRYLTLLIMLESNMVALQEIAKSVFEALPKNEQVKLHAMILDSPHKIAYTYGLEKLYEYYDTPQESIPSEIMIQLLEHSSTQVKAFISKKVIDVVNQLGNGNKELFLYYVKTILYLPNKVAISKQHIYALLPTFVAKYQGKKEEIEQMLLEIGGSNIIKDSECALVTLAKIKNNHVVTTSMSPTIIKEEVISFES